MTGADPGFMKRGGSNIFDVAKYIGVLEVGGGGGVLDACQPSVICTEAPSFWRLKYLSFEGHLEKKMEYIFGNQRLGQEGN